MKDASLVPYDGADPLGWVTVMPGRSRRSVLPRFRLFGILGTWMESDVVAANIRNARTQGCERVYLVDNGSTDDTVAVACAEGAILARLFKTECYDEWQRVTHMNDVVAEVSEGEGDAHIWWLFLDADEFPHGPRGMTLKEYLGTLDEEIRIVGTRYFNHYPSSRPHYVPGHHPLDFQPLCEEITYPMCHEHHRKHPLQRHDRHAPRIECSGGFHLAFCDYQLYEAAESAFLHHFPFRQEATTRERLSSLWASDQNGLARARDLYDATAHMLARHQSLDAVYAQEWSTVVNFIPERPALGVSLKLWDEIVEPEHRRVLRWYSAGGPETPARAQCP